MCPQYTFYDKETQKEYTETMSISDMVKFLENNPNIDTRPTSPLISYNDLKKPSDGFRDRLREIKKSHRGSTINTF